MSMTGPQTNALFRYELLPSNAPSWTEAEAQVQRMTSKPNKSTNGDKALTVSVKNPNASSSNKRKGDTAEDVYREEIGDKEAKRLKKGMKSDKGREKSKSKR